MNEFKRCIRVFSHSPFKVRLMLLSMLCDMINGNRNRITLPRNNAAVRYAALFCILNGNGAHFPCFFVVLLFSSQNIFFPAVDLLTRTLYLLAALNILRLAVANPIPFLRIIRQVMTLRARVSTWRFCNSGI